MSQDDKNNENRPGEDPVNKILGLEDPNSVSAFEIYSKKNHQDINNSKQKSEMYGSSSPIRLVQEAARKFGLKTLSSELENLRYSRSYVMSQGS
jgi:hypothetical protein